jgi:DUF177 domain-containing protein
VNRHGRPGVMQQPYTELEERAPMRLPDLTLNVAQLLREEVGATRSHGFAAAGSLHRCAVHLLRVPQGLLVSAEAKLEYEAECSRCLRVVVKTEDLEFEDLYYESRPEDDPEAFLIANAQTIDITEALRQYFMTAAAMQPLCKSDCPGLCPVCGKDLQEAPCDCDRQPKDPRWQALAALRIDEG